MFINVYPNPNHGVFNVSAKLLKSAKFELQVVDIMGKQVAAFDYGNLIIYRGRVDLSFLPAGIYNLRFLIAGNIENRKIVID